MQQQGLQPKVIIYSLVIGACGTCGMLKRAFLLVVGMQQQGLQHNVITYMAVISASSPM